MIKTTITFNGTIEQLTALLVENGYTGKKPSYDENGQPIVDENGVAVLEDMTKEEYTDYVVKYLTLMPLIRDTTASLEHKLGSINHNAKQMYEAMDNLISVNTEIVV